jgi:hypothetical protein
VTGLWVTVAVVLLMVLVGAWFSWTATRLDQLHHRIDLGRESLNTQLALRSGVVLELVGSGALGDPEAVLLSDAAHHARHAPAAQAESGLSQVLRAVFASPESIAAVRAEAPELVDELAAACRKVELARRFHNDHVTSARALRSRRRVRWFRLAGHAPEPTTVDLDDVPPPGLDGR